MDPEGTVRLLSAILADLPKLDGAACRGRHEVDHAIDTPGRGRQHRERVELEAACCGGRSAQTHCPARASNGPPQHS